METPNKDIRRTIVEIIHNSNAAHLGSSLSAVEILNSVFGAVDKNKIKEKQPDRDRIILSKGHGTAALYAVMYHHGLLSKEEVNSYFKNGTVFAGHASHLVPFVEHSTGALGHGSSVGVGVAIGLRSKNFPSKVFVVTGDGELQEGSNWEAFMLAGFLKLASFCVLVDRNNLQQVWQVEKTCSPEPLKLKFESFNFQAFEVDGHNEREISEAIKSGSASGKPTAIICRTIKGKGVSFMENENIWHYRTPQGEDYDKAMAELA